MQGSGLIRAHYSSEQVRAKTSKRHCKLGKKLGAETQKRIEPEGFGGNKGMQDSKLAGDQEETEPNSLP